MIPVNLFTGFLGVGKTTAIADLLRRKPAEARWAVLQNEFGEATLDGAGTDDGTDGVTIREIGGGCVCCVAAPYLPVALHLLMLEAQPERLLIETSGLGHPARLLEMLRERYDDRLEVRATIGIVDPADFTRPGMLENTVFQDQVRMADVLVLNKLGETTPEVVRDFQQWANELLPPKALIAATSHGRLEPDWLDLPSDPEREESQ
jgi:G3E family GTPase